jgi:hypothetical protein
MTERTAPAGCVTAPTGQAPLGKHWYYRTDKATGQRCWRLSDRIAIGKTAAPATTRPVVSKRPRKTYVPAYADANASMDATRETIVEPAAPNKATTAVARPAAPLTKSAAPAVKEVTYDELLQSTFGSRRMAGNVSLDDQASSPPVTAAIQPASPVAAGFDQASFKALDRAFGDEPSLDQIFAVFVMSLGGVLALLALVTRSLARRSLAPPPIHVAALRLPSLEDHLDLEQKQGDRDATRERDRYGVPFMSLVPPSAARLDSANAAKADRRAANADRRKSTPALAEPN